LKSNKYIIEKIYYDGNRSTRRIPDSAVEIDCHSKVDQDFSKMKNLRKFAWILIYLLCQNQLMRYVLKTDIRVQYLKLSDVVKVIKTGYYFNQVLTDLPINLTYLELGHCYNNPLPNLPKNLTTLILGDEYDQPLNNLPEELVVLKLGSNFNKPLKNLPSSLKKLVKKGYFYFPLHNLPDSIEILKIKYCNIDVKWPKSLRKLYIGSNNNYKNIIPQINNLPEDLTILKFTSTVKHQIKYIPKNLKVLYFSKLSVELATKLPNGIEILDGWNAGNLPLSLKEVTFDDSLIVLIVLFQNGQKIW